MNLTLFIPHSLYAIAQSTSLQPLHPEETSHTVNFLPKAQCDEHKHRNHHWHTDNCNRSQAPGIKIPTQMDLGPVQGQGHKKPWSLRVLFKGIVEDWVGEKTLLMSLRKTTSNYLACVKPQGHNTAHPEAVWRWVCFAQGHCNSCLEPINHPSEMNFRQ